jgi:hypothetical protein
MEVRPQDPEPKINTKNEVLRSNTKRPGEEPNSDFSITKSNTKQDAN